MKIRTQCFRRSVLSALLAIPALLGLAASSALALDDVLDMPAMKTDKAHRTILTDVTLTGDRLVAVGQNGHVIYSDDNGTSWVQASVPVRANLTSVTFVSDLKGWTSGHGGVVLHTEDGGETWNGQLDGNIVSKIILASSEKKVARLKSAAAAAEGMEKDDLMFEVENAEWLVDDAKRDLDVGPAKPIMDLWFKNDQEGFAIGAFGYFLHTLDGGKTWEDYSGKIDNPDSLHLYNIIGVKGNAVFVAGEQGTIFRSKDGGSTWDKLDSIYSGGLFGLLANGVEGQVSVYGLRGNAYYTEDFGDTWQKIATNSEASIFAGLQLDDKRLAYLGQGGKVLICEQNFTGCNNVPRKDRSTLSSAVTTKNGQVLLTGMRGVAPLTLTQ